MSNELDRFDRLAAEKIMGWNYEGLSPRAKGDWKPTRNISQAFECLDKLNPYAFNLQRADGEYFVSLVIEFGEKFLFVPEMGVLGAYYTAPETIVRACLKAKGIEI